MPVFKGEESQLLAGLESTQGTTVTPDHHIGKIEGEVELPDPETEWDEQRWVGAGREAFEKFQGQYSYSGTIPVKPVNGKPLAYIMGSDSVAVDTNLSGASETGTDTHTITAASGKMPPSLTVEAALYGISGDADFVRTFAGCVPPSGEISVDNESELSVDMDFIGMGVTTGTSPTSGPSLPTVHPWSFADAKSDLTMFGKAFARVLDASITIENGAEAEHYVDGSSARDPLEILYGNATYEMSVTVAPTDDALYQELVTPTAGGFDAVLHFERANGDEMRITAGGCNVTAAPHGIPEDSEKVEVELELKPETLTIEVEDSNSGGTAYL